MGTSWLVQHRRKAFVRCLPRAFLPVWRLKPQQLCQVFLFLLQIMYLPVVCSRDPLSVAAFWSCFRSFLLSVSVFVGLFLQLSVLIYG